MKVLIIHNFYQQPGGEDVVFTSESRLLREQGHDVIEYNVNNDQIRSMNPLALAVATIWSNKKYYEVRALIRREKPQVAHFHNTFPLISPAVYYAARSESVPVVQILHNYRLLCPNALFFRERHVCGDCLGRFVPWPGVVHRCYRGKVTASSAVAAMLMFHRVLRTWNRKVDIYIALTEFARRKFINAGFPAEKIVVKPNFVYSDPGVIDGKRGYALFVGRLSAEKGVNTLLSAWELLGGKVPIKIVGDGPLANKVLEKAQHLPGVEWVGWKKVEEVYDLMGEASFVIVPSEWYETFGRVVIEAFAKGTPVLVSAIGALRELVDPGRTGLHFRTGDPEDLAAKVEWAWSHPRQLAEMRREARVEYEAKYTAERNYKMLIDIYQLAISRAKGRR